MSASVEISVSVYSVVSCQYRRLDIVKAYLYDHTTVHDLPGYSIAEAFSGDQSQVIPVVLKTTSVHIVTEDEARSARSTGSHVIDNLSSRARQLAQGQCDRLSSGLFAARPCGAAIDAYEYIAQLAGV